MSTGAKLPMEPSLMKYIIHSYEGEYIKSKDNKEGYYHGKGCLKFKDGRVYDGEFRVGCLQGYGVHEWPDGVSYEGEFKENLLYGNGKYNWPCGSVYQGGIVDGLRDGQGVYESAVRPIRYEGFWKKGKHHGKGLLIYDNQVFYDGDWREGLRDGKGLMKYRSGNVYEGEWKADMKCGWGIMNWYDLNERYTGNWKDDSQNGYGEQIWMGIPPSEFSGIQNHMFNRYCGQFRNGKRNGIGTFYYANGSLYSGEWVDNIKEGIGLYIFENGEIHVGTFHRDRMVEYNKEENKREKNKLFLDDLQTPSEKLINKTPINNAILQLYTELKMIYKNYSSPHRSSFFQDGIFTMNIQNVWQLCYDCQLFSCNFSLSTVMRVVCTMKQQQQKAIHQVQREWLAKNSYSILKEDDDECLSKNPYSLLKKDDDVNKLIEMINTSLFEKIENPICSQLSILFREFVEVLFRLAKNIADVDIPHLSLQESFLRFYEENLKNNLGFESNGNSSMFCYQQDSEVFGILKRYHQQLVNLFDQYATAQSEEQVKGLDTSQVNEFKVILLTVRKFLHLLREKKLIDSNTFPLTKASKICVEAGIGKKNLEVIQPEDMDSELVFEEFLEGLVMIAREIYPSFTSSSEAVEKLMRVLFFESQSTNNLVNQQQIPLVPPP